MIEFIIQTLINVIELFGYFLMVLIKSRNNFHYFDHDEEFKNEMLDTTSTPAQQEEEVEVKVDKQHLESSLTVFSEDTSTQSSVLYNVDKTKSNESLENNASTGQPPVACASEGRETATSKQEQEPSNNKESVIAVQPN